MSATVDDLELPPAVFATCPWQPREPIETGFAAMAALLCTRAVGQRGGRRAVARRRRTAARPDSLHGAVCGVLQQGLRSTSPPPSQGRRTRGPARGRRLGRRATPEDGPSQGSSSRTLARSASCGVWIHGSVWLGRGLDPARVVAIQDAVAAAPGTP